MLKSLYIQNYALINRLDIKFEEGFSVITGETGAGKSIILGAIGLLLGQRADSKMVKNGTSKCTIEAHFDISDYKMEDFFKKNELEYDAYDCILRRELQSTGKSRAFINDSPTSLSLIKELGEKLIDIHSQHQNLLLNQEQFQLNVIDILADNNQEIVNYKKAFQTYHKTCLELSDLMKEAEKNRADEEFIRFQLNQLEEANIREGEQEELEEEADILNNAENIKSDFYHANQILSGDENGVIYSLKEVSNVLKNTQKHYLPANEIVERLESCYIDLKDIAHDINFHQEKIELNPTRLSFVNERLNTIYSLQQKYHVQTDQELIEIKNNYQNKLEAIVSYEDQISQLHSKRNQEYEIVIQLADQLTQKRKGIIPYVQNQMKERLMVLGMPNVRFIVEVTSKKEPDITGKDTIALLFSANKNGIVQPISSIASGGEIARVMLSLKALIAGQTNLPTIIFDEIDTGVSGEIADKMASIMQEMGSFMQVISITHLPQIAAKGNQHYRVYKEEDEIGTTSNICRLTDPERIQEVAHMLSGATITEAAINNARVLLQNNN